MKAKALYFLKDDVVSMGRMVNSSVEEMASILKGNPSGSMSLIEEREKKINDYCKKIEETCLELLLEKETVTQKDIRLLVSTIIIAAKLERMGDHANRIAKVADWARKEKVEVPTEMAEMASVIHQMAEDILIGFLEDAPDKALEVLKRDTAVDLLHDVLSQRLLADLGDQDKAQAQIEAQFLFCTRFLERMGDACTSIAKRVYFIATGERVS